jgi:hypothetical protein
MMIKSVLATMLLGVGMVVSSIAAPAPADRSPAALHGIQTASFWAQPYPYGYRWRITPCVRKVCSNRVRVLGSLVEPEMPRFSLDG